MSAFISWYLLITILGWITFPLVYRLFPALSDRGYTLVRAFGLLIWGYVFWLLTSLEIAQNNMGGLLLGLVILIGLSAWAYLTQSTEDHKQFLSWIKGNKRLIISTEILFLLAFAFMAFVRANDPNLTTAGGEKWMEEAFINAILHSPTFPPHDPWLSGYAISYYYFGYVMTAMLAMFTSVTAGVAHNLMLALIFALSAVGAYGILLNLLSLYARSKGKHSWELPIFGGFFAPLFLLFVSNLEGLFESLYRRGVGWTFAADGSATSSFWSWLNLRELVKPPAQPLSWVPDQFFWWWRASRVIQDYELNGTWHEVIDEFPFFSYLLGDLHPHVLAMPFMLLAIAMALNIFLGGWRGRIDLFFGQLRISQSGFVIMALMLGGLAFLNTWDILPGLTLFVVSYVVSQVRESGWGWERFEDVLLLGLPALITAYIMYLPFFISFSSQAGGIVPNFMFVTRGAHLWVMWGTLFIPLMAFLIFLWRTQKHINWSAGILTAISFILALLVAMIVLGLVALKLKPDLINPILASQGLDWNAFVVESMKRRGLYIGSLLTLLAILIPALSFLFSTRRVEPASDDEMEVDESVAGTQPAIIFTVLLIAIGTILIIGPDFFYLRDNFGYRINTVFKFYYQAWELLSIAAAFGVAVMFSHLRGKTLAFYSAVMVLVISAGLVYPVFALPNKTNNFDAGHADQRTLDGTAYLATAMPDDYQAVQFMKKLQLGVVAEAVKDSYSEYARISTLTGMPAVLGWENHEGQWRDPSLQGSRRQDIELLYTTNDWNVAQQIISRYNIRYIYVGGLERNTYRVNEEKFSRFLKTIYQQGNVTIYEVP